jgi:hypothetical protein
MTVIMTEKLNFSIDQRDLGEFRIEFGKGKSVHNTIIKKIHLHGTFIQKF